MDEAAPCGTNSKQKVECGGSEVAAAEPGADEQHGNHVTAAASADDPFGLEDMLKQEKSEKKHKSVFILRSSRHAAAVNIRREDYAIDICRSCEPMLLRCSGVSIANQ